MGQPRRSFTPEFKRAGAVGSASARWRESWEVLCRVLTMAWSGYYAWRRRPLGARAAESRAAHTEPATRRREASMGVRGFIRICAPTGFGSAAIASLGSCGCMGSAVSADRGRAPISRRTPIGGEGKRFATSIDCHAIE